MTTARGRSSTPEGDSPRRPGSPGTALRSGTERRGRTWGGVLGYWHAGAFTSVSALLSFRRRDRSVALRWRHVANAGADPSCAIRRWDGGAWFDVGGGYAPGPGGRTFLRAKCSRSRHSIGTELVPADGTRRGREFLSRRNPSARHSGTASHGRRCRLRGPLALSFPADVGGVHALYAAGRFTFPGCGERRGREVDHGTVLDAGRRRDLHSRGVLELAPRPRSHDLDEGLRPGARRWRLVRLARRRSFADDGQMEQDRPGVRSAPGSPAVG